MKKPITIWTIVLSLIVVAGFNSASAQERIIGTTSGTTATTVPVVEKLTPEELHLQSREERLLQSMTEEERLIYKRKKIREDYENQLQGQQGLKQSSQSLQTIEQQRKSHLQQKAAMRNAGAVEIPLSKYNQYPAARKKLIKENPDKYFINNSN